MTTVSDLLCLIDEVKMLRNKFESYPMSLSYQEAMEAAELDLAAMFLELEGTVDVDNAVAWIVEGMQVYEFPIEDMDLTDAEGFYLDNAEDLVRQAWGTFKHENFYEDMGVC